MADSGETWRTREGQVVRLSEMEDRYLLNAIAYMQRRLELLLREQARRGLEDPRKVLRAARRTGRVDKTTRRFAGLDLVQEEGWEEE